MIKTGDLFTKLSQLDGTESGREVVLQLIEMSLAPKVRQVYQYIRDNPGVSTPRIARRFQIEQNHAGGITKHLLDLRLVRRQPNEEGGAFFWKWFKVD